MARALYQADDDDGDADRPDEQRTGNPVDTPRAREPEPPYGVGQGGGGGKGGGSGLKPHRHQHCHSKYHDEQRDIDRIDCSATGDKARSDYISVKAEGQANSLKDAMQARQTTLDELPSTYGKARHDTLKLAETTRARIEKLYQALCNYPDEKTKEVFTEAWERVLIRVRSCTGTPSWCPPKHACDFSYNPKDDSAKLKELKHRFGEQVVKAEAQFDELANEPVDLTKRGTDLVKEVDAIQATIEGKATDGAQPAQPAAAQQAANADKPPLDYRGIYAKLNVAKYHAQDETLINGIPNAAALEYFLGVNLTCSVHGRRALTAIIGILAERDCKDAKKQARCDALKADLAKELLAEVADLEDEYASAAQQD